MKNVEIARRGMERAERWLRGTKTTLDDKRWDDVVFSAQMAVEQSAKAVLFALGIDYPKEHDVSGVLARLTGRNDLPNDFKSRIPKISSAVRELAEQRGLAGYGFEQEVTVDYFKDYAPEALKMAKDVHKACGKLLDQIFNLA